MSGSGLDASTAEQAGTDRSGAVPHPTTAEVTKITEPASWALTVLLAPAACKIRCGRLRRRQCYRELASVIASGMTLATVTMRTLGSCFYVEAVADPHRRAGHSADAEALSAGARPAAANPLCHKGFRDREAMPLSHEKRTITVGT